MSEACPADGMSGFARVCSSTALKGRVTPY